MSIADFEIFENSTTLDFHTEMVFNLPVGAIFSNAVAAEFEEMICLSAENFGKSNNFQLNNCLMSCLRPSNQFQVNVVFSIFETSDATKVQETINCLISDLEEYFSKDCEFHTALDISELGVKSFLAKPTQEKLSYKSDILFKLNLKYETVIDWDPILLDERSTLYARVPKHLTLTVSF